MKKLPKWKWESKKHITNTWENVYLRVYDFIKKNDRYPNRKKENNDDLYLVNWIERQKYNKNNNKLSQDKIEKLEKFPNWK